MTIKRTTIPEDQTTFVNPNPIDDAEFKIIVPKKPNRSNPFFYENDVEIAEIKHKGYRIFAYAQGDISLIDNKNDEEITNHKCRSSVADYWDSLDDKMLSNEERFEWTNNNWFEISAISPENKFIDLTLAEHDYNSAISAMKDVLRTLKENGDLKTIANY